LWPQKKERRQQNLPLKSTIILCQWAFSAPVQDKNIFNFVKIVATKKERQQKIFRSSFVAVVGLGYGDPI
jgi:hypothetical protein